MEWTTPKFEEVCLSCEINSYAKAELEPRLGRIPQEIELVRYHGFHT
jgi:coenzyme PQQ precursor peptide PqqA